MERWYRMIRRILELNFAIKGPAPPKLTAPA